MSQFTWTEVDPSEASNPPEVPMEAQYFGAIQSATGGEFSAAMRVSLDGGLSWTVCDGDEAGAFDVLSLPAWSVAP